MLRNELRKLKEEDLMRLRERYKRIEKQKKQDILIKDQEHDEFTKHIRD